MKMSAGILLKASAAIMLAVAVMPSAMAQEGDPLAGLSAEKKAFLSDKEMLAKLALTPDKVRVALAGRSPADAEAYVGALMAAVEDAKYKPGVDMGEIPLNPQAMGWNAGTIVRPKFLDEVKRDDGPFSLKRYFFQRSGVATFADAPVAIRKEDLVAGKIEVAFVGVPLDLSSGRRDAKRGPKAMRAMDGLAGADADGGIDPSLVLRIADYGDLSVDQMSAERTVGHVRSMIGEMAGIGVVPFIVGGDHTLMFPDMAAMADVYGADNVALVQFDAHAEAELDADHSISDKQSLTRLIEEKLVDPRNVIQVGVRGRDYDHATAMRLAQAGVRVHSSLEVGEQGWKPVADAVVGGLKRGPKKVFLSFDMSVLDPGTASGVGRPVPGGLSAREAIAMVRQICSQTEIVGFELLDTAPALDTTYVSVLNGNYILHACLSGIALRKSDAGTRSMSKR